MKRKLLSILLTLCLAFSLLPTAALAEGGPDTNLPAADENGVITLTNDVTITGQQWVIATGETLTLDLNGRTMKISKYTAEKGQVLVKGTLTVKDSSEAGTGKICSDYTGTSGRVIDVTGGTLYIQGGTITTEGMTKSGSAVYVGGSGTVEMIAGTVTGSKASDYVMNVRSGACTITGGKVLGGATNNYAVFGVSSTTVEISGNAEINATNAVTAIATAANIKISGGTFTGTVTVKTGSITGGTFDTDVSAYVAGGYVQKGNSIETLQEGDAEAKIDDALYPTLITAFKNAKADETIVLLKDVTFDLTSNNITVSKNLTLDLNNHKITNTSTTQKDIYVSAGEFKIIGSGSIIAPNSFGVSVVGGVSARTWKPIKAVLTVGKDVSIEAGLPAVFIMGYGAVVNVYGKLTGTGIYATIQGNGTVDKYRNNGGTEINIYDGAEVVSQNSDAMYVPQSGTINVYGGTVIGKGSGIGFKSGSLNVSGGTIKATGEDSTPTDGWSNGINASGAAIQVESNKGYIGNADHAKYSQFGDSVKISISDDAVIESVNGFAVYEYLAAGTAKTSVESLKITGGQFKSAEGKTNIKISEQLDQSDAILISGGLFTANTNLTKYCAEGLMAVENKDSTTKNTYPYTIGEVPSASVTDIEEHTEAGATDGSVSESVTDKTAAEAVARSVTTNVASTANDIEITDTEKKTAIQQLLADGQIELDENGNVTAPTGSSENVTVTIIKQPYLDVEVTALNSTTKELSLTIEPKYNLLATTDKDNSNKSVVVSTGNALTVTGEMEVTLALPNGFAAAGNKLSIKHTKGNSTVEYYTGTVSVENGNLYVTFTTKGFSPFTISAPAASIGETMYPTLAEAIAKAANGNAVKLEKNCEESVSVSGKSLTIDKNNYVYDFTNVTVDSNSTKTENGDTLTITYTAPSSSSGSSGYYVSTPSKTENGTVTVSPRYADKGDTVTVTVKPDSGYVLETLTVTDKNGNELTLKDKGNGKYTFTMPSGKVEVKATFMEDNSMLNFFYDVPNNAYFYEAVKWAVENGITTGVGDNLFAPEQPCTRAQIVTFLWRAAGSPEPKGTAAGMTDVVSGSYYEKAVAWAIENGITTGTTTSTFSPDATCTRAQAVTFLARALNAKAASAAEFSDVPTDSYFADAVAWAAANGVTEGIGGGLFGSDNDCTRGQIVTFLYRAYNK